MYLSLLINLFRSWILHAACDFLGEKLAGVLGLNAAKYQYAIDQYHRDHKGTNSQSTKEGDSQVGTDRVLLSPGQDGSGYGATCGGPAADQGACYKTPAELRNEGSYNRGYQEEDD
uniref:Uncharacterized protein n=1 Tax=Myripristis murdjan TaxID=586833 RepID=A0A667Y5C6_9TELE